MHQNLKMIFEIDPFLYFRRKNACRLRFQYMINSEPAKNATRGRYKVQALLSIVPYFSEMTIVPYKAPFIVTYKGDKVVP